MHIYNIYKFTNIYIHYNFTVERTYLPGSLTNNFHFKMK